MKKSSALVAAMMVGAIGLSACAKNVDKQYTTAQLVDAVVSDMNKQNPNQPVSAEQRAKIEEAITVQQAVVEAAKKDGLDKQEHTQMLLALQKDQVIMSEYMRLKLDAYKPTDDELKAIYDKEVAKMKGSGKEYHLRHILVDSEVQAKDIIAKLKAGAKFADLAKGTKDTASAAQGGDLGWNTLDKWVPEFAEAAGQLTPNAITETPVKSQFGYHVIQLVEAPREAKAAANMPPPPAFEQVKPQILEMAKQDYMKKIQDGFLPKKDAAPAADKK
ncbi:peptidylprolyl isomerase [Hydromonas duriensis]|uniref:peptidylprolyl isomerase n=1 Tax=Hydromonas duriensis TaxID=1527608 RepID=A0A4R6YC20_9BURK|nr:peptidylprolyl isomerase [Hydromonas duriensis]TDR33118.1 peptidyl-prolyl cis-trans isomerase C [Hydromonas duriensis]